MQNISLVKLALRLSLALTVFTATHHGIRAQGPLDGYLKGKGVLDLAPSFSFMSANTFAGVADARYDLPWRGSMLGLFGEYGLSERVDVVATGAYIFTAENNGLQDGSLHVKYRPFYRERENGERIGVLLATGLQFPLTRYEIINAGALGQRALIVPLALMGQWETAPGVFFHLQAAYNHRIDRLQEMDIAAVRQQRPDFQPVEPASFYTALFRVGFPARRFYTDAWVQFQHTPGGADYAPSVPDLPQSYGVSFTQIGGVLYYSENGKNGFLVSFGKIIDGRNVNLMGRITLGAVFKLQRKRAA
ncbi:MAG: hypothetical protein ACK4NS_03240 [Saprospiraceae bacterium]